MRNIVPFDPEHWPQLEKEGWTLAICPPPHTITPVAEGCLPVKKYIGQLSTGGDVIESISGLVQVTYGLNMVEPNPKFLRYRRYITTAYGGSEPTVFCWNEGTPEPEFVAWIDRDWQKANLP